MTEIVKRYFKLFKQYHELEEQLYEEVLEIVKGVSGELAWRVEEVEFEPVEIEGVRFLYVSYKHHYGCGSDFYTMSIPADVLFDQEAKASFIGEGL